MFDMIHKLPLLIALALLPFPAVADPVLERAERELRLTPSDTASRERVARDLRLFRAQEAPFLGPEAGQSAVRLQRIDRVLRQSDMRRGAAQPQPISPSPRRSRMIETGLPEVSLTLEDLE
ncbi:MAG: hypothetical protein AAGI13_04735 [Pseudomonadota bacterium]